MISIDFVGLCIILLVCGMVYYKRKTNKENLPITRETIAELHRHFSDRINVKTRTNKKEFSAGIEDIGDNFRIIFVKEPQELYVMYKEDGKYKRDRVIANTTTEITYNTIRDLIEEELNKVSNNHL